MPVNNPCEEQKQENICDATCENQGFLFVKFLKQKLYFIYLSLFIFYGFFT